MTWGDLVGAVASPGDLACVDEVLDDDELPADLLELAVFDDGGLAQWPVWSNVYFGVLDDDTLHWPTALWECLGPQARTAALLSASVPDFEHHGIAVTAELQRVHERLAGGLVVRLGGGGDSCGRGKLRTRTKDLDRHLSAIDERLGFEVGTCLEAADAAVGADPGDDVDAESAAATAPAETQRAATR